jgi:uncharacterized protein
MKKTFTVCCALLLAWITLIMDASAQIKALSPQSSNSHQLYVQSIRSAQDSLYQQTLRRYDQYISQHPEDIQTQIEKCRFIQRAFYGEDDEYNPKQDEFDLCLAALCARHPENPSVLIFQSEFLYGDSAIATLSKIIELETRYPDAWAGQPVWQVYQNLAWQYSYQDDKHTEAIQYAEKACQRNDTLDLTLMLAQQYKALSKNEKAIEVLTSQLDRNQAAHLLNQKAELLLQLKQYDAALKTFNRVQEDTTTYINYTSLAKTLEEVGRYAQARQYLLKDTAKTWRGTEAFRRIFIHDLQFQSGDMALASYNRLRDQGFETDPLGIQRIRLFLKHPLLFWKWRDLLGIGFALLLVGVLLLIPYVLILPIHYLGLRKKQKGWIPPATSFRWGLRHFWYVTFAYLLVSYLVLALYVPETVAAYFSENSASAQELPTNELAKSTILFMAGIAFTTALQLRPIDFALLRQEKWSGGKALLVGGATAIGLGKVYSLFRLAFQPWLTEESTLEAMKYWVYEASIRPEISAINQEYGFFISVMLVAALVPVYEEIIFRGIILSSCEKHLSFLWANLIQAVLFALVHEEMSHFFFYFGFGLLAGFLRRRSHGLTSGIVFHSVNNFLALMVILRT